MSLSGYLKMNSIIYVTLVIILYTTPTSLAEGSGVWNVLQESVGVSAMHMQLLHNDRVVLYDRTDFGNSNITFPDGRCQEVGEKKDCTAHSIEYNVLSNTFRPLFLFTDTWCSSGSVDSDGRLVQTGGFHEGEKVIRLFLPCDSSSSSCDWVELKNETLIVKRWYSSNHPLPNGQSIIVGGLSQPNYEFFPKTKSTQGLQQLPFLGASDFNNLYPFIFLNTDGNLLIFANNRAILLDYKSNQIVRDHYPVMPDGSPRNYPSTGSAVLLPLHDSSSSGQAEIMVCGGAPSSSYAKARQGTFIAALKTCGRMKINDPSPKWEMEDMPMSRVMGNMILLPNGHVLIVNGCGFGTAGWGLARTARLNPITYKPTGIKDSRFEVENPSTIPRVYHSTALLLRDGRVMVGGSNTHGGYVFQNTEFPTLLSLEAFSPSYLDSSFSNQRPKIIFPLNTPHAEIKYGQEFHILFLFEAGLSLSRPPTNNIQVTLIFPSFDTHSFSQAQRMLVLTQLEPIIHLDQLMTFQVTVAAPSSANLAPPGYYMLFLVNQDIPSEGIWVRILA